MHLKVCLGMLLALFVTAAFAGTLPAPVKALQRQGLVIRGEMSAPPGFRGFLADYKGRRIPVYLLPDGKHTMIGNLFDADGRDLTRDAYAQAVRPTLDKETWQALEKSTWIAEGARHPHRIIYVISDTECPYCHRLWQQVQPMLAHGNVQVRYVMVAVIKPESLGRAAAILSDADPAAALRRHEANFRDSPIKPMLHVPAKLESRLQANNELMSQLGVSGTPAIIYHGADGRLHLIDGLPSDPGQVRAIFGS